MVIHAHGVSGNPAQWFGPDAYPPAAIRRAAQGRTVATLAINADGRVTGCVVKTSSDVDLDKATCRIAIERGHFSPATDFRGKRIASSYALPVRWVLPDGETAPRDRLASTDRTSSSDEHGWFRRVAEAHHLLTFLVIAFSFLAVRIRGLLGWVRLDEYGRPILNDQYFSMSRFDRLRSGRLGPVVRVISVIGPVLALATILAWLGW